MTNLLNIMSDLSKSSHSAEALHILQQPDGYYTYLSVPKPPPNQYPKTIQDSVDKNQIEKNYRKLSLKLHPDRNGGESEAFRLLERAKTVLLSEKLRKGYDLLGLDLEEDDHHDNNHHHENQAGEREHNEKSEEGQGHSSADSVMSHMASSTVAAVLQLAIRTVMMAVTSLFLVRYKYLALLGILFLTYTAFQIKRASTSNPKMITTFDFVSPMLIAFGVILMYLGKGDAENNYWTKTFWLGEALIMTMFCLNTIAAKESSAVRPNFVIGIAAYIAFAAIALIVRGKGWRYITILGMEMILSLAAILIFPIMEMILEEIMNEKMRKIGEKVRLYNQQMEESYKKKMEELSARIPQEEESPKKSSQVASTGLD